MTNATLTKKITLATIKAFINKNRETLHIKNVSDFDTMTDCVTQLEGATFNKVKPANGHEENTFGIHGAWFVGNSRDYFDAYDQDGFRGYVVSNSCGRFILAIPVNA